MTESAALPAGQAGTPVIDPRLPKLAETPGFLAVIADGWGTPDRAVPMVDGAARAAAAHRRRLGAELPGRSIVVGAGRAPVRANDTQYGFRPDSDFCWLTGCTEAEGDRKSTRLNSSHIQKSRMPSSA